MSRRLPPRAGELIDRSDPVRFTWNGTEVSGFRGDSIVSALAGAGERIFSRSMKYHRPRGILTADYWDPNCRLQVGDEPNVRAAHRLVDDGMAVSAQNAWPSLDFDVRAANGAVSRFLTAGFYYKTFMKPARLWPAYEKVLATFAPGGTVDLDTPHGYYDKRYAHPDVVVAGGGPAGMAAALAAADLGARVMLVEHDHRLGGHLLVGDSDERTVAADLVAMVTEHPGIEVLIDSTVTGRHDDNWTAIVQRSHPIAIERLIKARAKVLVVAPGLIERPYVFQGNDRPGVMLSGAARRLIERYSVKPGDRAVVLTANASGDAAVRSLESAGVQLAGVVDARSGRTVVATHGSPKRVEAVELDDGSRVDADLLV
ncbi:MAG: 2Fe-2S iron-sulfur cluster-binding protein, partial [Acidimicrobiia bacterium]|nr:2Fe-2S iron-sulfur cluster-binding protein [Acidimicrobiia bacterium]